MDPVSILLFGASAIVLLGILYLGMSSNRKSPADGAVHRTPAESQSSPKGDSRFESNLDRLHSEARRLLVQQLMAGESVKVVIKGVSDQAIIATDRRLFIYKRGFIAGALGGQKMGSWDYRNLTGIEMETGVLGGAVILQVPGGPAADRGYLSAFELPNAIPILKESYEIAAKGVAEIRRLLADHQAGDRPASRSLSDELERLVALHDRGQLTDEEFAAMKGRLISQE